MEVKQRYRRSNDESAGIVDTPYYKDGDRTQYPEQHGHLDDSAERAIVEVTCHG